MAMTLGGVNYPIRTYDTTNVSAQEPVQKTATTSNTQDVSSDSAAYAVDARLTSNVRDTTQSAQTTQDLSSIFKIAESATNNTIQGLEKIREQIVSAANDTNASLDRRALQKEINQAIAQIDANAYVQYNGNNLFDSSQNSLMFAGINGYETFQFGDLRAQTLGLTDTQGNVTIDVSTVDAAKASLEIVDMAATRMGEILDSLHLLQDYVMDGFTFNVPKGSSDQGENQKPGLQQANSLTRKENRLAALPSSGNEDFERQMANFRSEQTQQQLARSAMVMFDQNRASILTLLP